MLSAAHKMSKILKIQNIKLIIPNVIDINIRTFITLNHVLVWSLCRYNIT